MRFRRLQLLLRNHLALGPFLLEMADELLKQKKPKEVADLLVKYEQKFTPSPYIKTLLGLQLAAAYEDLKQYPKAILILNGLINTKLLEDKIYFDLGRYYQFIGETTKSRQSFDHVIKQHPHSNFSKLAEVYAHKDSIVFSSYFFLSDAHRSRKCIQSYQDRPFTHKRGIKRPFLTAFGPKTWTLSIEQETFLFQ